MPELRALIAAAGSGTRAGLPYPKTLHPVRGKPILVRQIELLKPIDPRPVVIVSPAGREPIARCLADHKLEAELIEQPTPTGMGDAILQVRASSAAMAEHLLVLWGDIPLLQRETIDALVAAHLEHGNDFTFATRVVERAYTIVERAADGRVVSLIETREAGLDPGAGERDIGLFLMRAFPVLDLLDQRLPGAFGRSTGEHGFLYIVAHLAERGHKIEALAVARALDLVSLNSLADLEGVEDTAASAPTNRGASR